MRWGVILAVVAAAICAAPAPASQRAAQADFSVALDGPAETSVGGRATYQVVVTNAGPNREPAKVRITRGHGATTVDEGEPLRTASLDASQGTCASDPLGVICRPGAIEAGAKVKFEIVVKVFDADLPKLALQATVAPELDPSVDADAANDHAEVVTPVREPIAIDGIPDGCATKPFKVDVRTDVPKAKRTKLIVDGKVLATTGSSHLNATIKPKDFGRGSHRLSVVVQGGAGSLATARRKFKSC